LKKDSHIKTIKKSIIDDTQIPFGFERGETAGNESEKAAKPPDL
jgi:hypothetical protein